jgi:predicted transcriptional regulator of viral defense system
MRSALSYRDVLREIALDQYGYVTTKDAADAGVPPIELPKLAARGGLMNIGYGLYRVPDIPPHDLDEFAEALLRAGAGAFLYGESVLAVFGLADVNPRQIRVGVRRRTRAKVPDHVELVPVEDDTTTTHYEGLRSQTLADAILACQGRIERVRLLDAARQARKEGLLTTTEWTRVRKALEA